MLFEIRGSHFRSSLWVTSCRQTTSGLQGGNLRHIRIWRSLNETRKRNSGCLRSWQLTCFYISLGPQIAIRQIVPLSDGDPRLVTWKKTVLRYFCTWMESEKLTLRMTQWWKMLSVTKVCNHKSWKFIMFMLWYKSMGQIKIMGRLSTNGSSSDNICPVVPIIINSCYSYGCRSNKGEKRDKKFCKVAILVKNMKFSSYVKREVTQATKRPWKRQIIRKKRGKKQN